MENDNKVWADLHQTLTKLAVNQEHTTQQLARVEAKVDAMSQISDRVTRLEIGQESLARTQINDIDGRQRFQRMLVAPLVLAAVSGVIAGAVYLIRATGTV